MSHGSHSASEGSTAASDECSQADGCAVALHQDFTSDCDSSAQSTLSSDGEDGAGNGPTVLALGDEASLGTSPPLTGG